MDWGVCVCVCGKQSDVISVPQGILSEVMLLVDLNCFWCMLFRLHATTTLRHGGNE